jgi:DNA-binding transcriptional ArsR family regulator
MSAHSVELISVEAAPIFTALGDKMRLSLLSRLQDGQPRSVIQLTDGTGLSRQGVRKHLNVLEDVGLVKQEKVGRECRFVYQPRGIEEAKLYLDQASAQWDRTMNRLKVLIEE